MSISPTFAVGTVVLLRYCHESVLGLLPTCGHYKGEQSAHGLSKIVNLFPTVVSLENSVATLHAREVSSDASITFVGAWSFSV